jgi:hypothetical protein
VIGRPCLGACRPCCGHELLLRVAFGPSESAEGFWRQWKSENEFDAIDPDRLRLFPSVYRRLTDLGSSDVLLGRMKGTYRHTWCRNQWQLDRAVEILGLLGAAGIPTLVLKGLALIAAYYRDFGTRPMADIDVLVPEAQADPAHRLLLAAGWTWSARKTFAERRAAAHSGEFRNAAGAEVDLHWNVLLASLGPGADDDFWAAAEPLVLRDVRTLALCPTDQLLHVFAHGIQWSAEPMVRWVADALTILQKAGDRVDWGRLIDQSRRRRLTMVTAAALDYLAETFAAPVPPAVSASLRRIPVGTVERLVFEASVRPPRERPSWMRLVLMWNEHARASRRRHTAGRLIGFAGYLWDRLLRELRPPAKAAPARPMPP